MKKTKSAIPSKTKKFRKKLEGQEKIAAIRQAFADYYQSEGCSCCQDVPAHKEAAKRLAELLNVPAYKDGSGYDFYKFCSDVPA